jgi:hypothetical protein
MSHNTCQTCGMAHSPAHRTASELLAVPVITDGDVLDRVAAIISPAARRYRTLWLFFLHHDAIQANLVVPVDDIPERPEADVIGNVCHVAAQSIARAPSLRSVVITLGRPGPPRLTGADRHLLHALQHGASRHATPVRMLVLATPEGVRELGPVRPLGGRCGRRWRPSGHARAGFAFRSCRRGCA